MLQPKKEKKTVRFKRKKHLRNLERNKSGRNATVKMAVTKHYAAPTITFKGKEKAKKQNFKEALVAGEVYEFTSKRKAKNFACGSWKKGKSKLTRKQLRDCRKKNKS